jgi:uncharacterized protein (DUF433 family)
MKKQKIFYKIVTNPKIRFGKPTIEGTRIPVDLVVGKIAGGMTIEEVAKEYDLTVKQILSALRYAAKLVEEEKVVYI